MANSQPQEEGRKLDCGHVTTCWCHSCHVCVDVLADVLSDWAREEEEQG